MEQIDYAPLLPEKPLTDIVSFARQSGRFQEQYLVYKAEREYEPLEERMRPAVLVACSGCGKSFYAEKVTVGTCSAAYSPAPFGWRDPQTNTAVISGKHTRCPLCGAEAKTVHVGSIRTYGGELVDDVWVTELARVPVEGRRDRLALLEWCIRRCVSKQGVTRFEIWPFTAWVVEEKRIVRLMGYLKAIGGAISLFGEWRQRKTFCNVYGEAGLVVPWESALLEGTTAENCKLDLYQKANGKRLVSYLALWRRRPQVENLVVQGCGRLLEKWISSEEISGYYRGGVPKLEDINWKEKRPAQMLGLTKEEFRQMRRGQWTAADLKKYRQVRDSGVPVRLPEDMKVLKLIECYDCNLVLEEAPKPDFWRTVRYLVRQKEHWSTLRDYRRMAAEDGRDLTDSLVRFPRDLTAAHHRQIEERRIAQEKQRAEEQKKEMAERAEKFQERAAALERLSYALDGLLIRPCASEVELRAEGRALHHCVATYAANHASGATAILFIRRASAPDEPFFTLEFDEKRLEVLQNRGLRNCDRTPEVEAFEKAWLKFVRAQNRKRRKKAA